MNLYTTLATAKDDLRRARDHEATMRAIVEGVAMILGKSADDRKRELALLVAKDTHYKKALAELRAAEYAVDLAQAAIDEAEQIRRANEYALRCWEVEVMKETNRLRAIEIAERGTEISYPTNRAPIRFGIDDFFKP